MVSDWEPIGDYVMLERIERPKSTIVLMTPDVRTMYAIAKVLAKGPLVRENVGFDVGDMVRVRSTTGEQFEEDGDKYWLVQDTRCDLLARRKQ